ncbi:hypothetical protein M885DRAFT_154356 [Pelagophyceae sp. CCMP2097]|nr:hypothetical protein M885DRAFT_154356 [Pelagophyceae sp. CCMP2097]
MDDGSPLVSLPRIDDVEVPSNLLLRRAYDRTLHETVCMADVEVLWRVFGKCVAATLLQGKGCKLPGLLELTFDVDGRLMYELETDANVANKVFGSGFSVKWQAAHRYLANRDVPILSALPLETAARIAESRATKRCKERRGPAQRLNRKKCELLCTHILGELIRTARGSATSAALSICDVGEIVYVAAAGAGRDGVGARGWLAVRFCTDFGIA